MKPDTSLADRVAADILARGDASWRHVRNRQSDFEDEPASPGIVAAGEDRCAGMVDPGRLANEPDQLDLGLERGDERTIVSFGQLRPRPELADVARDGRR